MKKILMSLIVVFFLVNPGFAFAEETAKSKADATANVIYAPVSNSTYNSEDKRELISVNPYASLLNPVQPTIIGMWQVLRDPSLERTMNEIDWSKYPRRSSNPFKTVRNFFSYLLGRVDTISPENNVFFSSYGINNDRITFLSALPTGTKEMGSVYLSSRKKEVWERMITDAVAELKINTGTRKIYMECRQQDMTVANGGTATISTIAASVIGAAGNRDAREMATGITGTSGETTATHEILLEVHMIAFDDTAEEPVRQTSSQSVLAEFLVAPVFFDFNKWNIRVNEENKIQPIAAAIYQKLQLDAKKKIYLIGNCDIRGAEGYNDTLGIKRTLTVREQLLVALKDMGMTSDQLKGRIFFASAGKRQPIYEDHQLNRRVDVISAENITEVPALPTLVKNGN